MRRWASTRPFTWLSQFGGEPRQRVLVAASAVHLTNDACFALLYPLLPFIAADFGLSYAQVGLVKAAFSGASSSLQIPAGMVGERLGEYLVLLLGNAWVGLGLAGMALSGSFAVLLVASLLAGLGGNAQHPLAAALVSRAYEGRRLATAMGTLNFSGDLGKLVGPVLAGALAVALGWRVALVGVGLVTALFSLGLLAQRQAGLPRTEDGGRGAEDGRPLRATDDGGPQRARDDRGPGSRVPTRRGGYPGRVSPARPDDGGRRAGARHESGSAGGGFAFLLVAGALDSATRGAALTFLPFLLAQQGLGAEAVSGLFGLLFAAGAAGKFVCGWLGDRWGALAIIAVTELATAVALVAFPLAGAFDLGAAALVVIPLTLVFGFALNGTSSALTASVARLVPAERRARGYGAYFTAALLSQALAPLAYGILGDLTGLATVFRLMAVFTVAVIPFTLPVRRALVS